MGQSYSAITDGKRVQFSLTVEGGTGAGQVKISLEESFNGKTVAVTGANGFIGSHIVQQLLGKGYKVHGTVQDIAHDDLKFLKMLPNAKNLSLFQGELLNDCFDKAFEGCDGVFHLASPTLKDTEDMKNPGTEMVELAVNGTRNVLQSCKKMGVKSVILTSSMCAAVPKPATPEFILEANWADHKYLLDKGSHYAAAKTMAERAALDFLAEMPRESAFRLVRICPTFTVGPMLQPVVNSSMKRFAAICRGTHHARIPNRSISLIDVRDTAAHHIAAYEGMHHEDRFFSLTEAWPWTLVYEALKIHYPGMKSPEPLPKGTQHRPVRKYNTTRQKLLGIRERSFMEVLQEAVKEVKSKNISGDSNCLLDFPLEGYLGIGGYYDIGLGSGTFFMIEVICKFTKDSFVSNKVQLSWLLEVGGQPTAVDITSDHRLIYEDNKYMLTINEEAVNLTFTRQDQDVPGIWTVTGSIGDTNFTGTSYLACVPFAVFYGKYSSKSGQSIFVRIQEANNIITDFDGNQIFDFSYNPLQRRFFYQLGTVDYSLSFNAASGHGLVLTLVESGPESARSTSTYYKFPSFLNGPVSSKPSVGAAGLASYVGYYPLAAVGAVALGFVSITPPGENTPVKANVCINGKATTEYTSFVFQDNQLTFTSVSGLKLTFGKNFGKNLLDEWRFGAYAHVTVEDNGKLSTPVSSFFSPVPITAYESIMLSGTDPNGDGDYSLQIIDSGGNDLQLKYSKDGNPIFDTSLYEYNSITQVAIILQDPEFNAQYILNFAYSGDKGLTCEIIDPESLDLLSSLYAVHTPPAN